MYEFGNSLWLLNYFTANTFAASKALACLCNRVVLVFFYREELSEETEKKKELTSQQTDEACDSETRVQLDRKH